MLMLVGNVHCLYSLFVLDGRELCHGKQITFSRRIGPQFCKYLLLASMPPFKCLHFIHVHKLS